MISTKSRVLLIMNVRGIVDKLYELQVWLSRMPSLSKNLMFGKKYKMGT
jgi:hypothetical protein